MQSLVVLHTNNDLIVLSVLNKEEFLEFWVSDINII